MLSNDAAENEEIKADLLLSILKGPAFKIRSDNEKIEILKSGRPMPSLAIINKGCTKTFQTAWYSIYKWLCGSQSYNKLFCWPCSLMRRETSTWSSTGIDDLKRFTILAFNHATLKSHLKAESEYNETLTKFGLPSEFFIDTNIKGEAEKCLLNEKGTRSYVLHFDYKSKNKTMPSETINHEEQAQTDCTAEKIIEEIFCRQKQPKVKAKISFKTWQDLYKDLMPVSKKLFKWQRRVARQELKNAQLAGEKLQFEIEVLKAKAEYYKSLKSEMDTTLSLHLPRKQLMYD